MVTMWFKRKSRAELIEDKAHNIVHDILISGFSNREVAIIIHTAKAKGREILESRKIELEKELLETCNAINSL